MYIINSEEILEENITEILQDLCILCGGMLRNVAHDDEIEEEISQGQEALINLADKGNFPVDWSAEEPIILKIDSGVDLNTTELYPLLLEDIIEVCDFLQETSIFQDSEQLMSLIGEAYGFFNNALDIYEDRFIDDNLKRDFLNTFIKNKVSKADS